MPGHTLPRRKIILSFKILNLYNYLAIGKISQLEFCRLLFSSICKLIIDPLRLRCIGSIERILYIVSIKI